MGGIGLLGRSVRPAWHTFRARTSSKHSPVWCLLLSLPPSQQPDALYVLSAWGLSETCRAAGRIGTATTLLLGIGGVIDELVRHSPVHNTFKHPSPCTTILLALLSSTATAEPNYAACMALAIGCTAGPLLAAACPLFAARPDFAPRGGAERALRYLAASRHCTPVPTSACPATPPLLTDSI